MGSPENLRTFGIRETFLGYLLRHIGRKQKTMDAMDAGIQRSVKRGEMNTRVYYAFIDTAAALIKADNQYIILAQTSK